MDIDYLKLSDEVRKAWFEYKAKNPRPIRSLNLVDFVAGWNAARNTTKETTELKG